MTEMPALQSLHETLHDEAQGYTGCAGINPVLSHPDNEIDATDSNVAGGDAFDLAQIGVKRARFVRITDTGTNTYDGTSGGFDHSCSL
jgi:hypothetical protein